VLLKNINDDVKILEELFLKLIQFGIKPYYLHHCDEVQGTSHFRVKLEKALDIIKELQGRNPGIAIPKFMVDLPEGGGKVPLTPVYLKEFDREKKEYIFYNYEFKNLYRIKDL
jgi:lysine 2,3-aminomutase